MKCPKQMDLAIGVICINLAFKSSSTYQITPLMVADNKFRTLVHTNYYAKHSTVNKFSQMDKRTTRKNNSQIKMKQNWK